MNRHLYATAASIALLSAAIGLAGNASAAPTGSFAMDTIKDLRDRGFSVRVNGPHTHPLTGCSIDAVRGVSSIPASTVYVNLRCPPAHLND